MKEDKITKRIKELQSDTKYTFKLTEDIINLVYRTAVEDLSKEKKDPDKVYKNEDIIITSSKELNKKFGTKEVLYTKEQLNTEIQNNIQKTKRDIYLNILKKIESNNDLMDVYIYVKEKCKEYGEPGVRNEYNNKKRSRENPWM